MRLRIADFGFRIACRVIVPQMLLAAMPMIAVAQSQPAHTPLDSATAQTTQPFRPQVPIILARSGSKAVVTMAPINLPSMELDLRAYGRVWATRMARNQKDAFLVEFEVPAVRVPTVFSVTPALLQNTELAQVVAYPDRDIAWDKKIVLYSCETPAWFDQWAAATGLPSKAIKPAELSTAKLGQVGEDTKMLLILGRSAAGGDPADMVKLAKEIAVNILVLDADWFGDAAGPVAVGGGQMRGDLLAITGKQMWAGMLEFHSHRQPCGTIANRWLWIPDRDGLPLVEAIAVVGTPLTATHPVVLNYLPWAEQLGRSESADATLLAILSAAAKAATQEVVGHPLEFIYPKKSELNGKDRPVLSAVRSVEPVPRDDRKPDYNPPIYCILDLRGKERIQHPEGDLSAICRSSIGGRQALSTLIILGDDPMLDEWKWLKLDRAKKTVNRADVVWLSDDDLPPSKESRIRLMLKLTELGVPLGPPDQEEERK